MCLASTGMLCASSHKRLTAAEADGGGVTLRCCPSPSCRDCIAEHGDRDEETGDGFLLLLLLARAFVFRVAPSFPLHTDPELDRLKIPYTRVSLAAEDVH